MILAGSSWLFGQGVDVMGNGGNSHSYWQCVELPQMRLYPSLGWPRVFAAGNGGAAYIPEGSPGLVRHDPGEGYVPVPGDLVIENPTAHNAYGHVAVVDRVVGNDILAVEQNASSTGRHTYTLNDSLYAGGYGTVKTILHAPQNDFTNDFKTYPDGTFLRTAVDGAVYQVVGGAPVYVASWDTFGGPQTTVAVLPWQITAMTPYPADGTFVRALPSGRVYRFAGGAPMYVASWDNVGGTHATRTVQDRVVAMAGGGRPFDHMLAVPADGTFIEASGTGRVYKVVGGAPLYVSSWTPFGGPQHTVRIDAIELTSLQHLRAVPTGSLYLRGLPSNQPFAVRNGRPFPVTSWSSYGGPKSTIDVSDSAITTCDHLSCSPLGALDSAVWGSGTLAVNGWAIDPNAATTPVHIVLSFDAPLGQAGSTTVDAGEAQAVRPDVATVYPETGTTHGFAFTVSVPSAPAATSSTPFDRSESLPAVASPAGAASPRKVWVYASNATGTPGTAQLLGSAVQPTSAASSFSGTTDLRSLRLTGDVIARRWGSVEGN